MSRQTKPTTRARPPLLGAGPLLAALSLCLLPGAAFGFERGPMGVREAPRAAATISLDQAVSMAERRYKARVVRADVDGRAERRVYVLRLLSEEGRVWTVRVDATTGNMF